MYQRKTRWWSSGILSSRSRLYILDRDAEAQHESDTELSSACTGRFVISLARYSAHFDSSEVQTATVAYVSVPTPFCDLSTAIGLLKQRLDTPPPELAEEVCQKLALTHRQWLSTRSSNIQALAPS